MKITKSRLKEIIADVLKEESEYQKFFAKALKAAGKSIPQMSDEENPPLLGFFDGKQICFKASRCPQNVTKWCQMRTSTRIGIVM